MEKTLDIRTLLNTFEIIREKGEAVEGGYKLDGITALSDQDGYQIRLQDDTVTLDINFHNTHNYHYERIEQLDRFVARLEAIEDKYR